MSKEINKDACFVIISGDIGSMQAMLLAAGFGTRLQPYSFIRPKPLFPVLNRPLLLLLIDMLQRAQCAQVIINGHYLSHCIKDAVFGLPDVYFQHEQEILGTGGSLRQALAHCTEEPLLVMNGDICHDIDIGALYHYHVRSGNDVTMALHDYPRFNTVAVRDEKIVSFRAGTQKEDTVSLAYTGVQVVSPDIIGRIPSGCFYHIIDLYEELIDAGASVGSFRVDGSFWHDIGTPEDYLSLHAELLTGSSVHSLPVEKPVGQWLCSPGATIGDNVSLAGWGCIGSATVGANVSLRNCVVWDGGVIPAGACLANEIVTGEGM